MELRAVRLNHYDPLIAGIRKGQTANLLAWGVEQHINSRTVHAFFIRNHFTYVRTVPKYIGASRMRILVTPTNGRPDLSLLFTVHRERTESVPRVVVTNWRPSSHIAKVGDRRIGVRRSSCNTSLQEYLRFLKISFKNIKSFLVNSCYFFKIATMKILDMDLSFFLFECFKYCKPIMTKDTLVKKCWK